TAFGLDHFRAVAHIDFATQVRDIGLDDRGVAVEVVFPHVVKNLCFRQHPVGVHHEVAQQFEFGGGEVHDLAATAHFVCVVVKLKIIDDQDRVIIFGRCGTTQDSTDPGNHFVEAKRFGDVVIATYRQAGHFVFGVVPGCQEDDREVSASGSQLPGDSKAVHIGQHDVEYRQVWVVFFGGFQCFSTVCCGDYFKASKPQ